MLRISMFCITTAFTFIIISAINAEEKQMETLKDLKVGMAAPDLHSITEMEPPITYAII